MISRIVAEKDLRGGDLVVVFTVSAFSEIRTTFCHKRHIGVPRTVFSQPLFAVYVP